MRGRANSILAVAAVLGVLRGPPAAGLSIYGADDRKDLYEVEEALRTLARSTVALFARKDVVLDEAGSWVALKTQVHGEKLDLHPTERFYDQPVGALGSGVLVGPDIVLTAGHNVESQKQCRETKFVFGFSVFQEGSDPRVVPFGDFYGCKRLIARRRDDFGADWALIRLDRRVADREPLKVGDSRRVKEGSEVLVIGHPSGLPTKIAGGARVRKVHRDKGYFVAPLDIFFGSSGSPVFDAETLEIVGVVARDDPRFDYTLYTEITVRESQGAGDPPGEVSRFRATVYPQDGGSGTSVTLASEFASSLNAALSEDAAQPAALAAPDAHEGPAFTQLREMLLPAR